MGYVVTYNIGYVTCSIRYVTYNIGYVTKN